MAYCNLKDICHCWDNLIDINFYTDSHFNVLCVLSYDMTCKKPMIIHVKVIYLINMVKVDLLIIKLRLIY